MKLLRDEVQRVSDLQLAILVIVRDEGPIHGHAIRKLVPEYSSGQLRGNLSSTYQALYTLEEQGYVRSTEVLSPEGRKRRQYLLTALGATGIEAAIAAAKETLRLATAPRRLLPGEA